MFSRDEIRDTYDELTPIYAERFCNELDHKPFDRNLLRRFVASAPEGSICDLGCGPGHIAAHLQSLGAKAFGVDLSPGMIAEASRRFPELEYQVGDMANLDLPADSLAGIAALYSIIHIEREKLEAVFREMHRVLMPGGLVLVSFHRGEGTLYEEKVLDTERSFECTLYEPDEVAQMFENSGLSVVEVTVRRPYDTEYPTQRVYILADKAPEAGGA
jgi:SAM-dependent methyltransferase